MTHLGKFGLGGVVIGGFKGLRGRWNLDKLLGKALDLGVSFVDLAPSYASEASESTFGQSGFSSEFKVISKTGVPYDGMQSPDGRVFESRKHGSLPTQIWIDWFRPEDLEFYCMQSLSRLGKEHLDAYLLHAIPQGMQLEPWVEALTELRKKGLAQKIGFSSDVRVDVSSEWAEVVELPLSQALIFEPDPGQTIVVNGILRETLGNLSETKRLVRELLPDSSILVGTGKVKNLTDTLESIS